MKGKIILTDITSPVEGIQVVGRDSLEIYFIRKIGKTNASVYKDKNFQSWVGDLHQSELKQIVVEYNERYNINSAVDGFKIAHLPLHPDDWKWALEHIGEEVEFKIDPCTPKGMKYGQEQYSSILQQTYGESAKLIHPTPVMYTEKEVKAYLEMLVRIPAMGFGFNLNDWWNKHKKK